jgi:hypothetical protein
MVARALRVELQLAHGLEEADQHGERGAQLVRDIGDEIAPHGLDSLGLGDIARQEQLLRLAVRHELQGEDRAADRHPDRRGPLARREIVDERGSAHEVGDRLADVGARVEPELRGGGVVAPFDAALGVEHDHAVGKRLRGAAKARQRVLELAFAPHRCALVLVQRVQHLVPGAAALGHFAGHRVGEPASEPGEVPHVVGEQGEQAEREHGPAARRPDGRRHRQRRQAGGGDQREGAEIELAQGLRNP